MAYGLSTNLLPRKGLINVYESWNLNAIQDTPSNNKKSNSNDLLNSHSSYFDKRDNQNNIRHSTTILPPKPFISTSHQRPSTCASMKIIHSTASLPCRPSTANNCTRFHDNMLKALMRNIDKYCGKDGKNMNPPNTMTQCNIKQEKGKKNRNMLESNTMVDIDKFLKHHQKLNENIETNDNIHNRKNTKSVYNKRKKFKSNKVKKGSLDEAAIIGSKTSVNLQSCGNSHLKDDKFKDIGNDDAAWEITDTDQIRNLVMPKETRNATWTLLNEKKFKDKNLAYTNNNNIGIRKLNPSIKPQSKGKLVNDFESLNAHPHSLLCDG